MSSPSSVTRSIALAGQSLRHEDVASAVRHVSDAAEAALDLVDSAGPGADRTRFAAVAEDLVAILRDLNRELTGPGGVGYVSERPAIRLKDIAGMEDVKAKLREMVLPLEHPDVKDLYGIRAGGGILLYGPPGNGKTTLARAMAGELGADFFCLSGADIRSKWVGESEQNLSAAIRRAKECEFAVLFFDDVDGILPQRGADQGADNRLVTQFLQEVGGFFESKNTMILLGATNNPWDVDPAVLRSCRFDHKIYVGLPDQQARDFLLRQQLGTAPVDPGLDLGAFSARLAGYTGSDITSIVAAAKLVAATRYTLGKSGEITLVDLEASLLTVPPSAGAQLMERYEEYARNTRA